MTHKYIPEARGPAVTGGSEKNASNNMLFYGALIGGLLGPEAWYTDAFYLDVAIPRDDTFVGATGRISDYPDYLLRDARDLATTRKEANIANVEAVMRGEAEFMPLGLTADDHKAFLRREQAFIDLEMHVGPDQERYGYVVARPNDLLDDNYILKDAIGAGVDPKSEEPFVYQPERKLYVPDPFSEPHLSALYKYLTAEV